MLSRPKDLTTDIQDPGQYLAHLPDLRAHKAYHNPAVYGTITGQLQSASTGKVGKTLKDGAMDFGAGSSKKEEKPPAKLGLASASKVNAKTAESGTASKVVPKVVSRLISRCFIERTRLTSL